MTDPKGPRDDRWYLSLMSPNTKGPKFAWLDPTSIYINAVAFQDLLDDLIADLKGVEFDVVGGCDAMGFVLGAGLAARTGRGFLPVRKAGKLCVDTDRVSFTNYSGKTQDMEMRQPAFAKGTRVLLARPAARWRRPSRWSNARAAWWPGLPPSPWKPARRPMPLPPVSRW